MTTSDDLPIEISVDEVRAMRQSGDPFLLLDVREPDEYETARIDGSTLIPMSELGDRLDELEGKESNRIVVHCHHGGRSRQVTEALRGRGFKAVQNMTGGIEQWSRTVDPEVPRY